MGTGNELGMTGRVVRRTLALALLPAAALLGACDDDPLGTDDDMEYTGTLVALNGSGVSGTVEFVLDEDADDDEFVVAVAAAGLAASALHPQHVHAAASCPTMAADANDDGFVDVLEGAPSYGLILLNLDSDLTDYAPNTFPTATSGGVVSYQQTASFDDVLAAISGTDMDDSDPFTKLGGEPLALETRTYVIHGVSASTELPESVASIAGLPAQVTLPVACAELTRVD